MARGKSFCSQCGPPRRYGKLDLRMQESVEIKPKMAEVSEASLQLGLGKQSLRWLNPQMAGPDGRNFVRALVLSVQF